jgi:hypothetical protein
MYAPSELLACTLVQYFANCTCNSTDPKRRYIYHSDETIVIDYHIFHLRVQSGSIFSSFRTTTITILIRACVLPCQRRSFSPLSCFHSGCHVRCPGPITHGSNTRKEIICQHQRLVDYNLFGSDFPLSSFPAIFAAGLGSPVKARHEAAAVIIHEAPAPQLKQRSLGLLLRVASSLRVKNLLKIAEKKKTRDTPYLRLDYTLLTDYYTHECHDNQPQTPRRLRTTRLSPESSPCSSSFSKSKITQRNPPVAHPTAECQRTRRVIRPGSQNGLCILHPHLPSRARSTR